MGELAIGTIPQWGTFGASVGVLLTVLFAVIRVLPAVIQALNDRLRVHNERRRDEAAEEKSALESWRALKAEVSRELEECQQARREDAAMRKRLDDENFRLRVVLTLVLDEIAQKDPGSQIILKAKAILTVPPINGQVEPPDMERVRLDEMLADLERQERKRAAGKAGEGPSA